MSASPIGITWKLIPFEKLTINELYDIMQLRQEVFVVEQACPYLDADGEDQRAIHLLGYIGGNLALYTRLFYESTTEEASIGRVIVKSLYRGNKLGYVLMQESENRILELFNPKIISLGAQAHLEHFYGVLGYKRCGENYDEDGIPHLPMHKFIPYFSK